MQPHRFSPAVHHHGPCVWRIARFHPPEEGQEGGGVLRHPVVWPGRELELPHLPLLTGAVLETQVWVGEREVSVRLRRQLRRGARKLLTLKRENVLTQYVASSTVSNSVTWMRP